ncbi:BTAD domain-containing putative transcriptional regulator [Salinibacterium soli]|uniref:BTAD domain-containing putative transcriptional regulator n=1 Tax=Antiquaquibacter soli TaxID=3064523 RepID=A0ABT9BSY2_9MICO|nr:BTAD domain-containing putative transcriptional regulator [Protaetiibacter sp. WY-16]MDO7883523.1 BTAD domain-containing putative transcriptional regulator [Protaetiibacter sp. WY-16]
MTSSQLTIALLGEPQLRAPGAEPVVPQAGRVTALLALLALEPSRVVSTEHLIEQLWDDEPPASAVSTLYVYVSRLRKQLAPLGVAVTTRPGGYSLDVAAESIDLVRFSRAVEAADAAARGGDWAAAADALGQARGLWRGIPFQGAIPTSDLQLERQRLERLRHRVDELDARTLLEHGDAAEAAERARALTDLEPLNEGYWLLRMDAEHRAGNTAVALSVFEEFRELVADALGIDPGPRLRELHSRVLREPAVGAPSPAAPAGSGVSAGSATETVGRTAARADIDRAVRGAREGRGRTVILEGPTGVGKTHLAELAARTAVGAGVRVAWAKAPDGGAPALWIVRELLGALPGSPDPSGASQLATLLESTSGVDDVEQSRLILAEAIAGEVVTAAAAEPVLVVLDDVQWADATTVHVLRLLAARLRSLPVSLLITARLPESRRPDIAAALVAIAGTESTTRHLVAPLTPDEVAQLPTAQGLSEERIHELWERTGGNAYFVTAVLSSGDPDALPASVGDLLAVRASALPPEARDVLDLAAVAGESLDLAVLGVAGGGGAAVLEAIEGGLAHGILVARDGGYRFTHSLARDAIVAAIPLTRRTQLHAAYADAIERLPDADSDDRVQELADHRYRAAAGVPDARAFESCVAAADSARAILAFDLAALSGKRALEMLPPGPDAERTRAEMLVQLTFDQRDAGDAQGAAGTLRRALRAASRLGERELTVRSLGLLGSITLWNWRQFGEVDREVIRHLDEQLAGPDLTDRERAELTGALAMELYYGEAADRARGREVSVEAVALAERIGEPALLARALNDRVFALWQPADDDLRLEVLDRWIALAGEADPISTGEVVARLHRGSLRFARGDVAGFVEDHSRAGELTALLSRPELDAQYTGQAACLALLTGREGEVRALIDHAHASLQRTSIWGGDWAYSAQMYTLARRTGDIEPVAREIADKAMKDSHRSLRWLAVLSLADAGRVEDARALQSRWGLHSVPTAEYWGTDLDRAMAAEVSLRLGSPLLTEAYDAVAASPSTLVVLGTALVCWGPRADLLARLADRLGRSDAAAAHRAEADRVRERVAVELGLEPRF